MKKTMIINLYGGPGISKSTSAAGIFNLLKTQGVNAELVREKVKEWAWLNRVPTYKDQTFLYAQQLQEERILEGKVDVIVTDSPVLISLHYAKEGLSNAKAPDAKWLFAFEEFLLETEAHRANELEFVDIMLKRKKAYNPKGRFHTEEQSKAIDLQMEAMLLSKLDRLNRVLYYVDGTEDAAHNVLRLIDGLKAQGKLGV